MINFRFFAFALSICLTVARAGDVYAQIYPTKPIRILTAGGQGGSDFTSRLVAQEISGPVGQQVIVENRSGVVPPETVARAVPDGYTLLVTSGVFWILPLMQETSYDPVKDFSPITLTNRTLQVVVVHRSLPVTSIKQLIALAKAKPGELNYASSATGTASHLAGELFNSMAGVKIVRIAYKGGGPAVVDLISGQVQLAFFTAPATAPHVAAGRLRALAVTSAERSALLPDLPTVSASGVPGYESVSVVAMFAPAKTPQPIITRLNQEVARVLNNPDIKRKFADAGIETVGSSPEQLAAAMKGEMTRMGKVIRDAGIRAE